MRIDDIWAKRILGSGRIISWRALSANPALTFDLVMRFPAASWDWAKVSSSPCVTFEDVVRHPGLPWDWNALGSNPNVDFETHVLPTLSVFPWKPSGMMGMNASVQLRHLEDLPELQWDYYDAVSCNPNVTIDYALDKNYDWNWYDILDRCGVSLQFVLDHLDDIMAMTQGAWYLASRDVEDLETVLAHRRLPWFWFALSMNAGITLEDDVLANPRLPWDWHGLSFNPNVTLDSLLSYPDLPWDWNCFSGNPNVTFRGDVCRNHRKPWNWSQISMRPDVTEEDIVENYPCFPWQWEYVSCNPNLSYDFLVQHASRWNWDWVCENESFLRVSHRDVLPYVMCHRIQRSWMRCCYDPTFAYCRDRLLHQFHELGHELAFGLGEKMVE